MSASGKAYCCVSSVRYAFSKSPQMVINIWLHEQIKCIIGVSLCHCILRDVFEIHQTISCTTEFFLSLWNSQIQRVSWFEIKRNTFLDFTSAKGVEKGCSIIIIIIIIYTYVQSFKRKTGRLKGFNRTFHGSSFIHFIFSFTSVYSFPGLLDAYLIAHVKPVWYIK